MRGVLAIVLCFVACGGPAKVPDRPADTDGKIVARGPCPTLRDQAAFDAAVKKYYAQDMLKAGLAAELQARPLTSIFTAEDRQRLEVAATTGRCERVTYLSGGLRVTGFVVKPDKPGPHPVVVYLRGGSRDFGKIEEVTLLSLLAFADAGFVVVATQYRGVDGGEGHDEFGGAEMNDVLALVPLAASLPEADPKRVFLHGGSRGGMQGLLALRRGLRVRAASFRAPMTDFWDTLKRRPELEENFRATMRDYDANKQQLLDDRSAVKHVDEEATPLLLLHARQDWRVSIESVQAFAAALAAAGREHKLVVYERDEHQLAFHRAEWIAEAVAWFAAHGAF